MISIVVPFYNSQNSIRRCLESIGHQTYMDYEVICVNDGSTDDSVNIIREFMKDNRIKLIEKEHENAGAARNIGMDHACGEYIIFVDADDFFSEKMLEKTFYKIESEGSDFCIFMNDDYDEDSETYYVRWRPSYDVGYIDREPIHTSKCIDCISNLNRSVPWDRLYRLDFLKKNNIRFQSIVRSNDVAFSFISLVRSTRISIIDEVLIHYCHANSRGLQSTIHLSPFTISEAAIYTLDKVLECDNVDDILFSSIDFFIKGIEHNFAILTDQNKCNDLIQILRDRIKIGEGLLKALDAEVDKWCDKERYDLEKLVVFKGLLAKVLAWNISQEINGYISDLLDRAGKYESFYLRELLQKLLLDKVDCIVGIYGTGKHTEGLMAAYQRIVGDIKCDLFFIDNYKKDDIYNGYRVIEVKQICSMKVDAIIISSLKYRKEFISSVRDICPDVKIIDFYSKRWDVDLFSNYIP